MEKKNNKVILLMGSAGSGKGTLGKRLETEGYEVKSVSDILRENNVKIPTNGDLVPDKVVVSLVKTVVDKSKSTVILDGFPRTPEQAKALFDFGIGIDRAVVLTLPLDILIERTSDRRVCKICKETYTASKFKRPKVEGVCDKCGNKLELVKRAEDEEDVVRKRDALYKETESEILNIFKLHDVKVVKIDTSKEYSLADVLS